jgi:hypothetical protein
LEEIRIITGLAVTPKATWKKDPILTKRAYQFSRLSLLSPGVGASGRTYYEEIITTYNEKY